MSTKIIVDCRFSFVKVWKAEAMKDGKPKFSCGLLIPKSDKKTVKKIEAAIEEAKKEAAADPKKWNGVIPKKLESPLQDGDEKEDGYEEYKGHWYLNAKSDTKPGVVDKNVQEILDQSEFYSGCYGKGSVTIYGFKHEVGGMGLAVALNNVQKIKDGPAFGPSKSRPEDDFAPEDDQLDDEEFEL